MHRLHPVSDTGLAAALSTLGIPLDPVQGLTRVVSLATNHERLEFIFHDDNGATVPELLHRTELVVGMWLERAKFEREQPAHPLVFMRRAFDARKYLLGIVNGGSLPPVPAYRGDRFEAKDIRQAAILRAHGFPLLATTGRTFGFPNVWNGFYARQLIEESQKPEGKHPCQWMEKYLVNYSQFVNAAKNAVPVLLEKDDDKTLMLRADAPPKVVDQFHAQFDKL